MEELNKMYGFKKALVGTILMVASIIIIWIAFIFAIIADEVSLSYFETNTFYITIAVLFLLGSLALQIVSLIFGIISIKAFKYAKERGAKPVATLILGISATAGSAIQIINVFYAFLMLTAINMIIGG